MNDEVNRSTLMAGGRHNELEAIGGHGYIAGLLDGVPDRPRIEHYVKMVRASADRRRAAKLTEKAHRMAEDPSVSTGALAEIGNDLTDLAVGVAPLPPQFSEEALALRFSRKHEDELPMLRAGDDGCAGTGCGGAKTIP